MIDRTSPRRLARFAGGLYLINIVFGAFAIGVVPAMLVVTGNAAATARNIEANELLYRMSLTANVVVGLTNVPLAMIFWELFKVVNRRLALLVVFFTLVATAIQVSYTVIQFAPLMLLSGGPFSTGLPAQQAQALSYLLIRLATLSYDTSAVFFAFYGVTIGYLILMSAFIPRAIGVLLVIDGLAYLVYSFADFLAPGFAVHLVPWIQLPVLPAEGSFCLWMLIVGLNVGRWTEYARIAAGSEQARWQRASA